MQPSNEWFVVHKAEHARVLERPGTLSQAIRSPVNPCMSSQINASSRIRKVITPISTLSQRNTNNT